MPRYVLVIEYDGTPFCGWQRQAGALSVQQVVEEAIGKMSGETVTIQAAGRTDAGVHALGQVVSFDLSKEWDPFRIREALNFHTKPHPVAIVEAGAVPDSFEARFSAIARHYEYRILNRRGRPALEDRRVWHCPIALDAEAMHAAAQTILGKHDFTTFRAAECQAKSPEKTLDRLDVSREGETIVVRASAAASCTRRCARWWARPSSSAKASGRRAISAPRSMHATALAAARWRRRRDCIS